MKAIAPFVFSCLLAITTISHAADNAYDIMVMEASLGDSKPASVAVDRHDTPGEIAFGRMQDEIFVGQRIQFTPLGIGHKGVEVVIEDLGNPVIDKKTGLKTQLGTKKILRMDADGVSRTIEVGGKTIKFRIHTIGGVGNSTKILIEQDAP